MALTKVANNNYRKFSDIQSRKDGIKELGLLFCC